MCYTKQASINAYLVGTLSSLALIFLGNKNLEKKNKIVGILFLYVALMQLIDVMIYSDEGCRSGWNAWAGRLGPLLIAFQPSLLFFLIYYYYKDEIENINSLLMVNLVYIGYVMLLYFSYLNRGKLCSTYREGRNAWVWLDDEFQRSTFGIFYMLMLVLNGSLLMTSSFSYVVGGLVLFFYVVSAINYQYHLGEFWCYMSNLTPLIILILEKLNLVS